MDPGKSKESPTMPSAQDEVQRRARSPARALCRWTYEELLDCVKECLVSPSPMTFQAFLNSKTTLNASRPTHSRASTKKIKNWGGTFECQAQCIFAPNNIEQCLALVELARRVGGVECRAIGKSHSPGDVQFTRHWLIQTHNLSGLLSINSSDNFPTISVLAGTYISSMHVMLERHGVEPLALRNLGSISEQTIGGLISTASHGTGIDFPVLSVAVRSLRIVCALPSDKGGTQIVRCSRTSNADLFNATLCGLGATGLIAEVTLSVDHWFKLKQISEECSFDSLFGVSTQWPAINTPSLNGHHASEKTSLPRPDSNASVRALVEPSDVHQVDFDRGESTVGLGKILAHRPTLVPACPEHRLPTFRTQTPSHIYPISQADAPLSGAASARVKETDDVTDRAQKRLLWLANSSQHVRIAWMPHAGMCTVMRINRTLEPIQRPGLLSRIYQELVGYHLLQLMIAYSRIQPSALPSINRLTYRLTHTTKSEHVQSSQHIGEVSKVDRAWRSNSVLDSADGRSHAENVRQKDDRHAVDEAGIDKFSLGTFDPKRMNNMSNATKASFDVAPLNPYNPVSVLVDAAPQVFNVNCLFRQYTNEWAIPLSCAASALRAMRDWLKEEEEMADGEPVHFPVEVRFVDADGIWLSPCHGRKTCYIGIVQYRPFGLPVRYRRLFAKFEKLMRFYGGRPHWAKAHTCGPSELLRLYPNLPDFLNVRHQVDPEGIFLNPYTRRHLLGDLSAEASPRIFKSRL